MNRRGRATHRGYAFIGLLIVLIIIAILTNQYFKPTPGTANKGLAKHSIDKSKDVACAANRMALQQNLQMWSIHHPNEPPSLEALAAAGINTQTTCPAGGTITIGKNGEIYCSEHNPEPPAAELIAAPPAGESPAAPAPAAPAAPAPVAGGMAAYPGAPPMPAGPAPAMTPPPAPAQAQAPPRPPQQARPGGVGFGVGMGLGGLAPVDPNVIEGGGGHGGGHGGGGSAAGGAGMMALERARALTGQKQKQPGHGR